MPKQRAQSLLLCGIVCLIAIFMTVTATNYSYAQFGDVEIFFNCSVWKCDKIFCPNETDRCHVEKYKSQSDPSILMRENICFSLDNQVLAQSITNETIDPSANVRLKVDTYRSGLTSVQESYATNNAHVYTSINGEGLPEDLDIKHELEQVELEKRLNFDFVDFEQIGRDVEDNVKRVNQQIEYQLQDIREQVANSFRNLFGRK